MSVQCRAEHCQIVVAVGVIGVFGLVFTQHILIVGVLAHDSRGDSFHGQTNGFAVSGLRQGLFQSRFVKGQAVGTVDEGEGLPVQGIIHRFHGKFSKEGIGIHSVRQSLWLDFGGYGEGIFPDQGNGIVVGGEDIAVGFIDIQVQFGDAHGDHKGLQGRVFVKHIGAKCGGVAFQNPGWLGQGGVIALGIGGKLLPNRFLVDSQIGQQGQTPVCVLRGQMEGIPHGFSCVYGYFLRGQYQRTLRQLHRQGLGVQSLVQGIRQGFPGLCGGQSGKVHAADGYPFCHGAEEGPPN